VYHMRFLPLSALLFAMACLPMPPAYAQPSTVQFEPAYAKWGRLAMRETQKKYPRAQMVDYKHVGRQELTPTTAAETFKLWLRQDKREWGVYVRITFEKPSEKVKGIQIREVKS
jgi:hypothetical protein